MSETEFVYIVECETTGYETVHATRESAVGDAYETAVEYTGDDSGGIVIQDMQWESPDGTLIPRPGGLIWRVEMPDDVETKPAIIPGEDEIESRHERGAVTVRRAELH